MMKNTLDNTINTITSECLAVRIRLLNRTVTSIFDDALRPLGIKVSQLNVLMVIAKRGPVSPSVVARRLNMEKSTVSRNVERIRSRGWIRVSQGDAGNKQILELSGTGRKLIVAALPLWEDAQAQTEALLGKRGTTSIHRAADSVWAELAK